MIPQIEFDELITIQDWEATLRLILQAARESTQDHTASDRIALQNLLLIFIKKSPAKVELLDTIARKAIDDLAVAEISASLQRIAARSAELDSATGLIVAVTVEAKKDARALKMEGVLDALAKAQTAIDALQSLEQNLNNPDQKLLSKLKSVAVALGDLSTLVKPPA